MKNRLSLCFLLALAAIPQSRAYGPEGHQMIGAIADRLLAHTPTGAKVSALLDGYSLSEVAIIPDTIKQWDKPGIDDPGVQKYFSSHPKIAEQLRVFWKANPPTYDEKSPLPSHHWFHYTDVPLAGDEKYGDGKAGRSRWDIVQMMRYCIAVLEGKKAENNERKITKPIAVILLAHFVGDIHQPLHVGAEYFDPAGHPANPDQTRDTLPDEGGNSLRLRLPDHRPHKRLPKLHGFWDQDCVLANLPQLPEGTPKAERRTRMATAENALTDRLAEEEPGHWQLPSNLALNDYPEAWANEILPLARAAHQRLDYGSIRAKLDKGKMVAEGEVLERAMPDGLSYRQWSAQAVLHEMHLAGWRLADLLKQALAPQAPAALPATSPNQSVAP